MNIKSMAIKIDGFADNNVAYNRRLARSISNKLIRYTDWVMQDHIYERFRRLTKPVHWLWIWGWMERAKAAYDEDPFRRPGVYIGTGEPGSGKSSLAMEIMHRMLKKTGKGSYINTAIEIPRVDEKTFEKYIFHPRYEITDFFRDFKIADYPNQFKFAALHIDEAHRVWQYRQNQSDQYMHSFKPFMDYAVGVRHYIGHIFLYTQMDKVDTQLMSLGSNNVFDVQVKKGFDYDNWMETGLFRNTILGWDLTFYKVIQKDGSWNKIERFKTFYKRTFDLKFFNSLNLQDGLKHVTFDNRYKTKEVRI